MWEALILDTFGVFNHSNQLTEKPGRWDVGNSQLSGGEYASKLQRSDVVIAVSTILSICFKVMEEILGIMGI